jgi:hypothetical protein
MEKAQSLHSFPSRVSASRHPFSRPIGAEQEPALVWCHGTGARDPASVSLRWILQSCLAPSLRPRHSPVRQCFGLAAGQSGRRGLGRRRLVRCLWRCAYALCCARGDLVRPLRKRQPHPRLLVVAVGHVAAQKSTHLLAYMSVKFGLNYRRHRIVYKARYGLSSRAIVTLASDQANLECTRGFWMNEQGSVIFQRIH